MTSISQRAITAVVSVWGLRESDRGSLLLSYKRVAVGVGGGGSSSSSSSSVSIIIIIIISSSSSSSSRSSSSSSRRRRSLQHTVCPFR